MPKFSTERLPKYRKHRASGQAIVTLNGKDHYLGPHGTKASKLESDRLTAQWLAAGRTNAQRYNAAGAAQAGKFHVNSGPPSYPTNPSVAMDAQGGLRRATRSICSSIGAPGGATSSSSS